MIECFTESAAWFPRLTETTQCMAEFEFPQEVLRGHYANLWKRSLIRIGDFRKLESLGTWAFFGSNRQTRCGADSERWCVLLAAKLEAEALKPFGA